MPSDVHTSPFASQALSRGGAKLVLTTTVNGTALVALGYKYNSKTILYFVFAHGAGSCVNGHPYEARFADLKTGQVRSRWVPRPAIITRFFDNTPVVDNHNQVRQANLGLETAWVTQNGWFRIETTLQGMNITDAWYLCKFDQAHPDYQRRKLLTVQDFANELAGELTGRATERLAPPGPAPRAGVRAIPGNNNVQAVLALHTLQRMPLSADGKRRQKYYVSCKQCNDGGGGGAGTITWSATCSTVTTLCNDVTTPRAMYHPIAQQQHNAPQLHFACTLVMSALLRPLPPAVPPK